MSVIYEKINFNAFDYKINIETENLEIKKFNGDIFFKESNEYFGEFVAHSNVIYITLSKKLKTWSNEPIVSYSRSSDIDIEINSIDEVLETVDSEIYKITQFMDLIIPNEERGIRLLSYFEAKLFNKTNAYINRLIKTEDLIEKEYIDKAHQFAEDLIFELSLEKHISVSQSDILNVYSSEWKNSIETSVKLKLGYTIDQILEQLRKNKK